MKPGAFITISPECSFERFQNLTVGAEVIWALEFYPTPTQDATLERECLDWYSDIVSAVRGIASIVDLSAYQWYCNRRNVVIDE
jgi:hypothetical protein